MPPKKKTEERHSWIVRLRCVVEKVVITRDCTEEEARDNTWAFVVTEREDGMSDWKVLKVEAND